VSAASKDGCVAPDRNCAMRSNAIQAEESLMTSELMRPTAEFRDYLEGEISREFRRERSYARLRYAAVLLATLAAGATAGLASAQVRESAQRDSLLETVKADLALAGLRLELARARLAEVKSKVQSGLVGQSSLAEAESEVRKMEAEAMRIRKNTEEIRTTALSPRDDLNAPLVDSRDFVTERLQLQLFMAQQYLTAKEQAQSEAERQYRVGTVGELAVLDAGLDVTRARYALGLLAERQKLRKEFVAQGTQIDELNRRYQLAQVQYEAAVAQEEVKVLRQRLDALQKQLSVGSTSDLDALRAELDLKERLYELQLLVQKLKQMRKPD
jgi:hypothetical protein